MAIVRAATEGDIPCILELYYALAITGSQVEMDRTPSLDNCRQVFNVIRNMPGHELLVAEDEGAVVGTTVLLIVPNLSHSVLPWAVVENMVVDYRYRRRGIGRLLMEYAIAQAREAGCYKMVLTSGKRRKEAHRFYRSLCFEAWAHGFRLYF